jgi:membrane-associated protein
MLTTLLYSMLALDQTVASLATQYGAWLYAILFIAGTVVAAAGLDVHVLVVVLVTAAVLGDSVNYGGGHYFGPKAFHKRDSRWFRQEYLRRTQAFYEKYGAVTIIIGRFVPIIRTFAPFLAGVAGMQYRRFLSYNAIGGCLWIGLLVYAGFLFGNIRWVKDNLSLIVIAIVVVSLIPAVTTFVKERRAATKPPASPPRLE